ncbi:hypothetical protein ACRALDRAFT_206478 [Sodiomyces alcalophilus JCM 7366]|uniref:uncharacterized protein n=1 Tax=Sodiomyces alcalophilus JCM 7366 TaxID=591952 RepID=UPI0039B3FB23
MVSFILTSSVMWLQPVKTVIPKDLMPVFPIYSRNHGFSSKPPVESNSHILRTTIYHWKARGPVKFLSDACLLPSPLHRSSILILRNKNWAPPTKPRHEIMIETHPLYLVWLEYTRMRDDIPLYTTDPDRQETVSDLCKYSSRPPPTMGAVLAGSSGNRIAVFKKGTGRRTCKLPIGRLGHAFCRSAMAVQAAKMILRTGLPGQFRAGPSLPRYDLQVMLHFREGVEPPSNV